jgi:hypothetical protein
MLDQRCDGQPSAYACGRPDVEWATGNILSVRGEGGQRASLRSDALTGILHVYNLGFSAVIGKVGRVHSRRGINDSR